MTDDSRLLPSSYPIILQSLIRVPITCYSSPITVSRPFTSHTCISFAHSLFSRYQSTANLSPCSSFIFGCQPNSSLALSIEAQVAGTSAGWAGRRLIRAFSPNSPSIRSAVEKLYQQSYQVNKACSGCCDFARQPTLKRATVRSRADCYKLTVGVSTLSFDWGKQLFHGIRQGIRC